MKPTGPIRRFRAVAKGTFADGSRYLRFPQSDRPEICFTLSSDGVAGIAVAGERVKTYGPGSADALAIADAFSKWDEGGSPTRPDVS